jgi:T4-like virus tail tube protein gp19
MADLHGFKFGNPGGDANLGSHFQVDYGASRIDHVFDVKGIGRTINHARAGTGSDPAGLVAARPARATMREVSITCYQSGAGQLAKVWKDVVDAKSKQVQRAVLTVQLLDDTGTKVTTEFIMQEAWMKEYESNAFDRNSTEFAFERAVFCFEKLDVKKG